MLKRKFSKLGDLGSMMVEALAMLGLISMVTPIVYKKAAERNTEIQDVNAASQLRNLIKGLDEYILDNYGAITAGKKVENKCKNFEDEDYNVFEAAGNEYKKIKIGHLCDYLPFGFLDSEGEVANNKIFDANYDVVIKKVEAGDTSTTVKKKVLTGFVVASPRQGDDFPKIRASRISSMVGGNGGYIEDDIAHGVQGMWEIKDLPNELGVNAENGSLITSSISPISHGGTNDDAVLYRKKQPGEVLNTMETRLLMGRDASESHNIININQAVITAALVADMEKNVGDDDELTSSRSLWIQGKGGAFIDGVLSAAANGKNDPNFYVDIEGGVKAAGQGAEPGSDPKDLRYKFEVDKDGALKTSDGKFTVDKDGAIKAAVGDDLANPGTKLANFTVDKEGSIVTQKNLTVKGKTVMGTNMAGYDPTKTIADDDYELLVNGNAFIRGLLRVLYFKADNIDAGTLRAGTSDVMSNNPEDYTLITDLEKLTVGVDKFKIDKATGNTSLKSGNLTVVDSSDAKVFEVNNSDSYTSAKGLKAGTPFGDDEAALEVGNNTTANIDMRLKEAGSKITAYDNAGKISLEIVENHSLLQKQVGDNYANLELNDSLAKITTKGTDGQSTIETSQDKIIMDVTSTGTVNNIELTKNTTDVKKADLAVRDSSSVKVFGTDVAPIVYIDPDGVDKDNIADKTTVADSKGGVYIRRGVVELEGNYESEFQKPKFKEGKDKGYIQADMFISKTAGVALDTNSQFYGPNDIPGGPTGAAGAEQYDTFMVNPAYTSVMHDIKLTSRGGARLSDILPDFINKGIYLADNTYKESVGSWGDMTYSVASGRVTGSKEGQACAQTDITTDGCPTSPWLGVVPTPQCPPGYEKVIQTIPYGFNIAQAGIPTRDNNAAEGDKWRMQLFDPSNNPKDQDPTYAELDQNKPEADPTKEGLTSPLPLYFQKNTWLKTRVEKVYEDGKAKTGENFLGWSVLMGYVYPTADWDVGVFSVATQAKIVTDTNAYIWNLFPVYYRELEAYSTVFCYFSRKDRTTHQAKFDENYVDVYYDQLNQFRAPMDKRGKPGNPNKSIDRLDDPNMDYKNPW